MSGDRRRPNRYGQLIDRIFFDHYQPGDREVVFRRTELETAAQDLGIKLPKNLGDVLYTFRYRANLPARILELLGPEEEWVIRPGGRGIYRMGIVRGARIVPNRSLSETRIPDATPGLIRLYALGDEQALLAILRYNRLIDTFLRITCYPLQSHLRTAVTEMGQVETDELYVGLDRRGAHYVVPVQAKGGRDMLSIVQIEQDYAVCASKFPQLICRPVGAQFMEHDLIALFEFERSSEGSIRIAEEKHYRLVPGSAITPEELAGYRTRAE